MKRISICTTVLICCTIFWGCEAQEIYGYWESAYAENKEIKQEAARVLTVDIKEDGTGVFTFSKNEDYYFRWSEKDEFYHFETDDSTYQGWISGDTLIIEMNEIKIHLVRDLKKFVMPPNIKKGIIFE